MLLFKDLQFFKVLDLEGPRGACTFPSPLWVKIDQKGQKCILVTNLQYDTLRPEDLESTKCFIESHSKSRSPSRMYHCNTFHPTPS